MAAKHTIHLKVRRIDNGYIVTGSVEKGGGSEDFPEEFYASLADLDMAISERLAGAEKMAAEIKEPEPATIGASWLYWGGNRSDDDDDD
jgi:hypothetical protein